MPSVSQRTNGDRPAGGGSGRRRRAPDTAALTRDALRQLAEVTGRPSDTVSAMERTDNGWRLEVELVELERVPATTNILATYQVDLDDEGALVGYRRLRRYYRNAAEEGWM
ncbi:MAG TPA: gas vesicle protein GvpO [Mycobacteriales bacterium]|nr:gas vesicle protein GvpO [Mycobacteriales bacterium]